MMSVTIQHGLTIEVCSLSSSPDLMCVPHKLGEAEVQVFYTRLDAASAEISRLRPLLSEDETERSWRFRFDKHRNEFILARGTLRVLLGSYLGITPAKVIFSYSEHGKPALRAPASRLAFNLSNTEGMAVYAFAWGRRIGVDVERVRTNFEVGKIAEGFFSVAEREALRGLPVTKQYEAFFRCWTRKEAYIKALGEGLSHPLHQFDVSVQPAELSALLATRPDATEAGRWVLRDIRLATGYVAALAVEMDVL